MPKKIKNIKKEVMKMAKQNSFWDELIEILVKDVLPAVILALIPQIIPKIIKK